MFRAFVLIVATLAVAVAGVLLIAARQPDTFRVTRSATINAPPEKIYPLVADFREWGKWSPYETKDPGMKRTFSGAASGKGAGYAWDGNKEIGAGSMEITDATAPSKVSLKLDFTRPFEAHNTVDFTMTPEAGGTRVTWDMRGPTPLLGKVIHVFIDMGKMVGGDFEAGLAKLKAAAEK